MKIQLPFRLQTAFLPSHGSSMPHLPSDFQAIRKQSYLSIPQTFPPKAETSILPFPEFHPHVVLTAVPLQASLSYAYHARTHASFRSGRQNQHLPVPESAVHPYPRESEKPFPAFCLLPGLQDQLFHTSQAHSPSPAVPFLQKQAYPSDQILSLHAHAGIFCLSQVFPEASPLLPIIVLHPFGNPSL